MVRSLVDVATADYDRWYLLAHSLGSVVAFNGLMTHAHSIPNYLDERRWRRLRGRRKWVGHPRPGMHEEIEKNRLEIPPRPLWITDEEQVVYRERLFAKFRGLLTYGSPLDKFAGMWPAYVPINRDRGVFPQDAKWINIFDRTDPVAASLKAYRECGLPLVNFGYKASPWLLLGHLKYLDLHESLERRGKEPADCVVDWLLTDHFQHPLNQKGQLNKTVGWYQIGGLTSAGRVLSAYLQWAIVATALTFVGVWVLRSILTMSGVSFGFADSELSWVLGFLDVKKACENDCSGTLAKLLAAFPSSADAGELAIWGAVFTTVVGLIARLIREDDDDPRNW
jgi:hypothetical protein